MGSHLISFSIASSVTPNATIKTAWMKREEAGVTKEGETESLLCFHLLHLELIYVLLDEEFVL